MKNRPLIEQRISESIAVKQQILRDEVLLQAISKAVITLVDRFKNGHHLWLCGNGGSAADAQHIAAEFTGRFFLNRPPLPAEAFSVNTSYITAVANDFSFDDIFSRMVQAQTRPGDVLIGLSTSGNSPNVVRAIKMARMMNVYTIAFTGNDGGELKTEADLCINIDSAVTPRIQESHILLGHIICELVESEIFGN
ncbi:MAG: phosphoheptose isomerase [Bacteroidetes bacterium HGW-Bacteroidetes-6]|jgi:D-sedoheptulose 7-phosphate isomerase|nr:MAG: phosphoheptose isomerase [Bacteroidetes bacterium HGW-Bacteroidetes-6]